MLSIEKNRLHPDVRPQANDMVKYTYKQLQNNDYFWIDNIINLILHTARKERHP